MKIESATDLIAYQKSFAFAMDVFETSKSFPPEERYALTSQIRRSSRSVSMNLQEAWAKRRYKAHFISKLTDCDGEINETETSLEYAKACGYIDENEYQTLFKKCQEVEKLIGSMIKFPEKFIPG